MFLGEILVITTFSSMLGIILMAYILNGISNIPYVDRMFINKNSRGSSAILYL